MRLSQAARRARRRVGLALHPTTQEDRNILFLYLDIACQGVVAGAASAYLSVFAVRLGASTVLVGLLSSLPALLLAIAAIPAGRFVTKQRRIVTVVVRYALIFNLAYLLIAGVPLLGGFAAPAIVVIWSLAALVNSVANVAFVATLAEAVPPHRRANVISVRYALNACIGAVTLQITGRLLTWLPFPTGYQVIFLASFAAALLSAFAFSRIRLPDQVTPVVAPRASLREQVEAARQTVRAEPAFFGYLSSATVFRLGMNLPSALYSVFWVNHLHLTDGTIATAVTLNYAFTVIGYYFWTRLSHRRGRAFVMAAACLGLSTYPLLTGLAQSATLVYVTSVIGGLTGAGVNLAFLDVLLATVPKVRRSTYVALDTGSANGVAFLGPLLGSLLDGALGIRPALYVAFAVRFLGASLFALRPVRSRRGGESGPEHGAGSI
ncbi:MAG: MFS transporter [Anaerolineae bacterium]